MVAWRSSPAPTKGIGLEIARQPAQAGIRVIVGAREDSRARAAVNDLALQGAVRPARPRQHGLYLRAAPAVRIVKVSSLLGSLTLNGDPSSAYYSSQFIGYNASKAALNMLTVQLHGELRDTPIVVDCVSPGFVKTDLIGYGSITPEKGARLPVRYALSGEESGRFVEAAGETPC